jgi:hypothetical protein
VECFVVFLGTLFPKQKRKKIYSDVYNGSFNFCPYLFFWSSLMKPFDIINDLSYGKKNILRNEKDYLPYLVNKAFSHHLNTVLLANEMNLYKNLDIRLQHDFYLYAARKEKKYSIWFKKDIDKITVICKYYRCSFSKAREYISLLSEEEIQYLVEITMDV